MSTAALDRGFTLRSATPNDAPQVSHLIGTTWAKFFAYSVTEQDLEEYLNGPVSVKQIRKDTENPEMRFLVATIPATPNGGSAESHLNGNGSVPSAISRPKSPGPSETYAPPSPTTDHDQIIAVVQLVTNTSEPCLTLPDPIELRRLYVSPTHHGSGVASALVQHAEQLAREEGYRSMWLGVWEENPRGARFYEKMGWKTVGEHKFLVGASVRRDWVMEKEI